MEDRKTIKKVDDMKKDFLSKLQRQNASILSSSFDDDLVPDMTVLDPEMMSKYLRYSCPLVLILYVFMKRGDKSQKMTTIE